MSNNTNSDKPVAQIIINFYTNNSVGASFPTNIDLTMFMMGKTLELIGQRCEYKKPSPIVQVPKGARIQ